MAHRRRRPPRPLCWSDQPHTGQTCQSTPKLVKLVRAVPKLSNLSEHPQTCPPCQFTPKIVKLVRATPDLSNLSLQCQTCQWSLKVVRALPKLTCAPLPLWRGLTALYVPYSLEIGEQRDGKRLGHLTLESSLLKIRRIEACQLIRCWESCAQGTTSTSESATSKRFPVSSSLVPVEPAGT